jgi:hypothetical protein
MEEKFEVGDLVCWKANTRLVGLVEKVDWFDLIVYWFDVDATQRNSKAKVKRVQ